MGFDPQRHKKVSPVCPKCHTAEHMRPGPYGAECAKCDWVELDTFVIYVDIDVEVEYTDQPNSDDDTVQPKDQ